MAGSSARKFNETLQARLHELEHAVVQEHELCLRALELEVAALRVENSRIVGEPRTSPPPPLPSLTESTPMSPRSETDSAAFAAPDVAPLPSPLAPPPLAMVVTAPSHSPPALPEVASSASKLAAGEAPAAAAAAVPAAQVGATLCMAPDEVCPSIAEEAGSIEARRPIVLVTRAIGHEASLQPPGVLVHSEVEITSPPSPRSGSLPIIRQCSDEEESGGIDGESRTHMRQRQKTSDPSVTAEPAVSAGAAESFPVADGRSEKAPGARWNKAARGGEGGGHTHAHSSSTAKKTMAGMSSRAVSCRTSLFSTGGRPSLAVMPSLPSAWTKSDQVTAADDNHSGSQEEPASMRSSRFSGAESEVPRSDAEVMSEKSPEESAGQRDSDASTKPRTSETNGGVFHLSPAWKNCPKLVSSRTRSSTKLPEGHKLYDDEDDGSGSDDEENPSSRIMHLLQKMVCSPQSPKRVPWDLLGSVLVAYDVIMIPMQAFDLPRTPFVIVMTWFARMFWSMDVPLSFLTGYQTEAEEVEMRPWKTAKKYAQTWMVLDVALVLIDWVEEAAQGLQAARMGKMLKSMRMIRLVRLLRVIKTVKVPEFLRQFLFSIQSETFFIILGIIKLMFMVAIVTHFIACCWYALGTRDSVGDNSWVIVHGIQDATIGYAYSTSFHWSLTQFTGSMDIQPHNVGERSYAVSVLLVAFVVSASVVSSITSSMTRLQIVTAHQSTMISMLNQYLRDNGISRNVATRVQRNALHRFHELQKNTPEQQIELLTLVSEPLRVELHYEIFRPTITFHPFFRWYNDGNPLAIRKVCHESVSKLSLSRGDMLFSEGEVPSIPQMYFCSSGKLRYQRDMQRPKTFTVGQWAAEGNLWTPWVHFGTAMAKTEVGLIVVNAAAFQRIAARYRTQEFFARRYAECFVEELNELPDKLAINDLDVGFDIHDLTERVFTSPA